MTSDNIVYLLLGSNTGDSNAFLSKAIHFISESIGAVITISSVYQTEPWGNKNQPPFLNQVIEVKTILNAPETLEKILEIEKNLGRERFERWAPRTLDIDILYFNNDIVVKKNLQIPHKELHNRNFTLTPLNEIAPDYIHPVFNVSNKELLKRCEDESEVKKVNLT